MSSEIVFRPPSPPKKRQCTVSVQHVLPGETISAEIGFIRGHGTYVEENNLIATVSGVVERVNKLVSVRPLKSRYVGEVGDVVVGRIIEVAQKKWKVDVNGLQEAILLLNSINLPGGIQRRRTHADERNMRSFFIENDLISAEVREYFGDGSMSIHTRNLKYGKLTNGQFLAVPPALIKRTKQAFVSFPFGVDIIIGKNGYIWISKHNPVSEDSQAEPDKAIIQDVDKETRENICRIRNAVVALSKQFIAIHPDTILDTFETANELGLHPKEMLQPKNLEIITQRASQRKKRFE